MTLEDLQFTIPPEWNDVSKTDSWRAFVPEMAKDADGNKYMRNNRAGRKIAYRVASEDPQGNQTYLCTGCDSEIQGANVSHTIWDGPGPCSGGGEVKNEEFHTAQNAKQRQDPMVLQLEFLKKISNKKFLK